MGQIMEMARDMSDSQLADVLQGKSLAIPQFAAMTEAMGRKSLRNATEGAQAKQQLNQPSLKERLLAENEAPQMPEDVGIAQIPAPNMESMNMAGGGIIAFDEGGDVKRFSGGGTGFDFDAQLKSALSEPDGNKKYQKLMQLEKKFDLNKSNTPSFLLNAAATPASIAPSGGAQQAYVTGDAASKFDPNKANARVAPSPYGAGSDVKNIVNFNRSNPASRFGASGDANVFPGASDPNYIRELKAAIAKDPTYQPYIDELAKIEGKLRREEDIKQQQILNAQQTKFQGAGSNSLSTPVEINPNDPYNAANPATPVEDKKEDKKETKQAVRPLVAPTGGSVNPKSGGVNPANPASKVDGGVDAEVASYMDKYSKMFPEAAAPTKRDNPFAALKYEGDSADTTREQGMGYGLMQAGAALLKNPTFAGGLGDAMSAFGAQGWATAKEVKAAKKEEREFNKDIAKANMLYEQGEDDKALKYANLAQGRQEKIASLALNTIKAKTDQFTAQSTADYQKGTLALKAREIANGGSGGGGILGLLNALKDPANMAIYQQMNEAKNPKLNTVTPEFSLNQYNNNVKDNPNFKKQFPTPQSYYNYVQQSSAPQPRFLGYEPQ
jgi:hypothetical protein